MKNIRRPAADHGTDPINPLGYAVSMRDKSVMQMVETALKQKQVLLAYQPIMHAQAPEKVAFYEALLRLTDETGRIIPAKDFIREIEATELGRIMDCIALEKGLRTLARQPDLRLSINMSARSIGYPRWMRTLKQGLQRNVTVAERLILEITESSAMTVPELVISFMSEIQAKGVSFALDDFGAGYTSFSYLRDFYFDIIKIDGQFIRGIAQNPDNQVLTSALKAIADQFDMLTVAEFVENAEDAAFLAKMGIDCLQGYYFAAPTVRPVWERSQEDERRA
ncbi:EAL domain-containing protein [uncultured Lentibacter sp.]|uniref:EAL domain-containing protein n=1 Tax=uncultured Lentibacter sp. TaxID=1659309 RepID=UPI00260D908B|nr:EAL domain-containing protein [uncultured Lentibacter sp.]MCW1954987.1 EAL domain-containing protein [Roseobacter sp.]